MLTNRQREILAHHSNGMTLVEVAFHLGISYSTCRNQAETAKKILGSHTLANATVLGLHYGNLEMTEDGQIIPVERKNLRRR